MNRRDALAALVALPAATRISSAELKPEDVIVVECPGPISDEAAKNIRDTMLSVWPGRKVVVLSDGIRLKIVEAGKEPT